MSGVAGSLVKRGMEAHAFMDGKKVKVDIPGWALVMLGMTAFMFLCVLFTIEYTFGRVIPTLVMIESPQDNISFEPLPTADTDDSMVKVLEPRTAKPQFITSSLRGSLRLLKSKGGKLAYFRGFSIFAINNIVVGWVARTLMFLPFIGGLPRGVTTVAATVLCAQLSMGWTQIVISEPSPKPWFRRIPTLKMWKKVAGPTAIFAIAEQLAIMLPLYMAINMGLTQDPNEVANLPEREQRIIIAKAIGIFILGLTLAFLVVIPANVTLTRIHASLLQDSEDTIVPFDRSFGGKVVPEIVGGSGKIGMLDAWKTFDWSARIRLIKAYLKVVLFQIKASIFFTILFVLELLMIGGFSKIIVPADGKN